VAPTLCRSGEMTHDGHGNGHFDMRAQMKANARLLAPALLGLLGGGALADDLATAPVTSPNLVPAAQLALGAAVPVSDEALGAESGKAALQLDKLVVNDQDLNGVLQGNVASNTTNGNNTISGDSFTDVNGFATAIQNTGNNTLIQNSTIINISMEP